MTFGIKDYLLGGLAIVLALSLWGNAHLLEKVDAANVQIGESESNAATATEVARVCSMSVDKLKEDQEKREAAAAPEVAASVVTQGEHQVKATTILATAPTQPGNDCGSAKDRAATWLKGRTK